MAAPPSYAPLDQPVAPGYDYSSRQPPAMPMPQQARYPQAPPSQAVAPAPAMPGPVPGGGPAGPFDDAAPGQRGSVLVFFSCRGGAGSTTLAVNVAAALARVGKNVCIVDLDLQLGDVFVALDLEPTTSLAALAREASTLDSAAIRRRLQRHDSGVWALGQTGRLDEVDATLADRMPALFASLAAQFDYVVVDGIRDFSDNALAALDMADRIAMVVTQDVPAVRRAERAVELFRRLGYSDRKLALVVNRHTAKASISEGEVERALQVPVAAVVRNDWRRMRMALDEGALLADTARGSAVANDVQQLASTLVRREAPQLRTNTETSRKPGLLARIFGGGAGKGGR